MPQAPSNRFRRETSLESLARAWPRGGVLGRIRELAKPVFEAVMAWRSGGVVESRLPGGEVVRLRPAWRHFSWNADEYCAFRDAINPGDVVIEAGANVGGYAVLFAQWVGAAGRVFAFEPDPRAFAALVDHIALNGVADRVVPIQSAVSDRCGSTRFHLAPTSGLSRIATGGQDDPRHLTVQATSIDDFCARALIRPAFLKVDVEGAELLVLKGARETIAAAGSRLRLFVEMHPSAWQAFDCSSEAIVRECDRSGLRIEHLDGSPTGLWELEGISLRLRPASAHA